MKAKAFRPALLLLILSTAGCVGNKDYHVHQPVEYVYGEQTKLVHVELDDFGDFWDMSGNELSQALAAIDEANQVPEGAIVVTFVHGWRNNSNPANHNLQNFKNVLGWLSFWEATRARDAATPPRPVVGVFISWRGKQTVIGGIDYYARNAAAMRVAGAAATEVLVAITARARENDRTRSIVIGHSMGALIVEAALAPAIDTYVVNARHLKSQMDACGDRKGEEAQRACRCRVGSDWRTRLPVDLVILVNAASYALEARKLTGLFQRWKFDQPQTPDCKRFAAPFFSHGEPSPAPMVVALTSESDFSTRNVLRAAAYPSTLTKSFRDYSSSTETGATQPAPYSQRALVTRSAGNFRPFYSHFGRHVSLGPDDASYTQVRPCAPAEALALPADPPSRRQDWRIPPGKNSTICFETGNDRFWLVENRDNAPNAALNRTPYWVIPIPSSVVAGHGRIFTWPMFRLIQGIVHISGATAALPDCDETGRPTCDPRLAIPNSQTPEACFAPPDGVGFTYRGMQSECPDRGACWPGEEVLFTAKVDGRDYDKQECEDLEWDFGDGSPLQAGETVRHVFAATSPVSLAVRSYLGRSDVEPVTVKVAPAEPLEVTYSGVASGCKPGDPCWVGEIVEFKPAREDVGEVEWEFDGTGKRQERVTKYTFPQPGRSRVRAAGVLPSGRGAGGVEVDVIEPDCNVDVGALSIGFTGEASGCTPERGPCKVGEQIVFTLRSATGVIPSCYRVVWSFDGRAESAGNIARFDRDGEQSVRAHVTAPKKDTMLETRVTTVCAPPARVVVAFRGKLSECTRETLCAGGSCRTGETIEFFPHEQLSAPKQPCDDIRWDFGDGRMAEVTTPTHHYDDAAPRVVSVTSYSTGGEQTDRFTIRFEPEKPVPPRPVPPDKDDKTKPPTREQGEPENDTAKRSKPCTIDLGPGLQTWHTVKTGECLSTIAESYYGRQIWPKLYRANCDTVEDPDLIYPKDRLRIVAPLAAAAGGGYGVRRPEPPL